MPDIAERKLLITPVSGSALSFTCNADWRLTDGIARTQGFTHHDRITFFFDRFTRARLSELEPVVGLNVRQTKNRSGKIQLTSDKPCSFVRCRWDSPRNKPYDGWNELYRYQEVMGVLEVTTASLEGLNEAVALTLLRGDWLYKADGTIERFV